MNKCPAGEDRISWSQRASESCKNQETWGRVKWPILYDRHKNVNTINLFSFYWPGSELCHANNQQNIHQPAQSDSRQHSARACALQLINACVRCAGHSSLHPRPTEMISPDHTQPSLLSLDLSNLEIMFLESVWKMTILSWYKIPISTHYRSFPSQSIPRAQQNKKVNWNSGKLHFRSSSFYRINSPWHSFWWWWY